MRKLFFVLLALFLFASLLGLVLVHAQDFSSVSSVESCDKDIVCPAVSSNVSADNYCIFFFYGQNCPFCAAVYPFVQEIAAKYPNFTLKEYEIYYNESNHALYQDFVNRYGIERQGIPALFVGDRALIGSDVIKKNLESDLQYFQENKPICPLEFNKKEAGLHEISPSSRISLTLGAVIIAAVIDSINPCAFAVLIFLLLYLSTIGSKRRMLKIGITYIVTVFIVYFLSGLGLFTVIQSIGATLIISRVAAFIAIFAGLINVKDFFWYGKGISLAIPESRKGIIEKYVQKASLPAAIVLGILVSLFELPCTGGVYLAILSLLASNLTRIAALPWLFFYNLIFILPLIIILLAVYFGASAEKAEAFRLEKRKWLRLIMGLVMIALGMAMLAGVFG